MKFSLKLRIRSEKIFQNLKRMFGKILAAVVEISLYRISIGRKNPKAVTIFKKLNPKWKKQSFILLPNYFDFMKIPAPIMTHNIRIYF